jgi:hypothetical protein
VQSGLSLGSWIFLCQKFKEQPSFNLSFSICNKNLKHFLNMLKLQCDSSGVLDDELNEIDECPDEIFVLLLLIYFYHVLSDIRNKQIEKTIFL